jgi:hypothetical protein
MRSAGWKLLSVSIALCVVALSFSGAAVAQDKVRIVLRAFIPSGHPGSPSVLAPVPGSVGKVMVKAPIGTSCFETDNRTFSNSPPASARVATDFTLIASQNPSVEPSNKSDRFRTGTTVELNCQSGKTVKTGKAKIDGCTMGAPAFAGNKVQIVTGCNAANPLLTGAPDIHYGGTFTYNVADKTLAFEGDIGAFPAFEAYASLNGGQFVELFAKPPGADAGPMSLIDLWLHINNRRLDVKPTKIK